MKNYRHHNQSIAEFIKKKAAELGFDACGIAKAESVDARIQSVYKQWLADENHGQMQYMANNIEKRLDPAQLVPEAKSVICLAMNYHQINFQPSPTTYKISQYAAGIDYHHVLKKKLYQLLEYIEQIAGNSTARVFTDSAPVLERYWAQMAGLGAPGKNSCLILPRKGSYFFLAEIIIDLELPVDEPLSRNMCGNCTRCIDACPTAAITEPGKIDARRCISYLTIELKEPIPQAFEGKTNDYIFGCDICQQVCPHNIKFATPTQEEAFTPLPVISEWTNEDWESLGKSAFKKQLVKARSPISRVSYEKLMQIIQIIKERK